MGEFEREAQREIENLVTRIGMLAQQAIESLIHERASLERCRYAQPEPHSIHEEEVAAPPETAGAVERRREIQYGYRSESEPIPDPEESMLHSVWAMLSGRDSINELLRVLKEGYVDPVPLLTALLDTTVPVSKEWSSIEYESQRAITALVALGDINGHRYLIRRIDLLCWNKTIPLTRRIRVHHAPFSAAAVDAWSELEWRKRAVLAFVFRRCGIPPEPILDLLCSADVGSLRHQDRGSLVEALEWAGGARAVLALHACLDHGIADISSSPSTAATSFVNRTLKALVVTQGTPTLEHRRRAAQLGLSLELHDDLAAFIARNPGCIMMDIVQDLKISEFKLRGQLRKLLRDGAIRAVADRTARNRKRTCKRFYAVIDGQVSEPRATSSQLVPSQPPASIEAELSPARIPVTHQSAYDAVPVDPELVIRLISAKPGLRIGDISEMHGFDVDELGASLDRLVTEGSVGFKGEGNARTFFAKRSAGSGQPSARAPDPRSARS